MGFRNGHRTSSRDKYRGQVVGTRAPERSELNKSNSPDLQVLRDKLVLDLAPCFRYLDKNMKVGIRVVTPMVMFVEAEGMDDAGIG